MVPQASSSSDLKNTLDLVLDQLANVVAHQSAAVLLINDDCIEVVAARGYPALAALQSSTYPLSNSPLLNKLLNNTQAVVFTGHVEDETFYQLACYGPGCACINIPLHVQSKPLGFLTVNRRAKSYTPEESQMLTAFARQTALTIENMRLYDAAQRRAHQLEAAAQVGRQLTLVQDLDQLLAEAVKVVREKFGYYQAHILLIDDTTNELRLKEASGPGSDLIKGRGLRLRVGQEGITGWVAYSGEPILCNDVRLEPRFYAEELLPETKAELAVPLRLGERVVGVLDVQSDQLDAFHPEDIIALQLIGDQVAIAIENARLFQETKGRLETMRALHDVSLDIVAQLDLSELLHTLLQRAARLVQAQGAVLGFYDERTSLIRIIASYQTWHDFTGVTLQLGEGLIGQVVQRGESLIVNDYAHWPHAVKRFIDTERPMELGVPLKWREQIIGGLAVINLPTDHAFTLEDVAMLTPFADLAAIALKNAQLYTQVKSFSHTLEEQVAERTRELVQARQQIVEKAEQVQWLLSKTVHIQEEERARIARDLHDSVTQLTIGAMLELQAAKADMDSRAIGDSREKVDMARDLLKQIEREIRQAIYDLRPALLDASGLLPALQKYAASFQELTGIRCDVQATGSPTRLPSSIEVVIFRIVQEALHNVMTHAHAHTVKVSLEFQASRLCLMVEDDGQGFDVSSDPAQAGGQHLGLISMRERAQVIGGQLDIWSKLGQGTRVTLRVATEL